MKLNESSLMFNGKDYLRPSGFLTETNLTAFSIVFSNLLLLFNIDKLKHKYLVYFNYLISGYIFGMLGSRSAFLFYLFILFVSFIIKNTGRKEIIYFFLIFTGIQLSTPQTQARLFTNTNKKQFVENDVESGRVLIWKSTFEAFKTSPLFGIGTDVFYKESLVYLNMFKKDEDFNSDYEKLFQTGKGGVNSHSLFLTVLTEYGLIGFAILMLLILNIITYTYRNRNYTSLLVFIGLLFVSALSSYAPYYKYYIIICMVFFININNDLKLVNDEKRNG